MDCGPCGRENGGTTFGSWPLGRWHRFLAGLVEDAGHCLASQRPPTRIGDPHGVWMRSALSLALLITSFNGPPEVAVHHVDHALILHHSCRSTSTLDVLYDLSRHSTDHAFAQPFLRLVQRGTALFGEVIYRVGAHMPRLVTKKSLQVHTVPHCTVGIAPGHWDGDASGSGPKLGGSLV